jgi:hypothetical protein
MVKQQVCPEIVLASTYLDGCRAKVWLQLQAFHYMHRTSIDPDRNRGTTGQWASHNFPGGCSATASVVKPSNSLSLPSVVKILELMEGQSVETWAAGLLY